MSSFTSMELTSTALRCAVCALVLILVGCGGSNSPSFNDTTPGPVPPAGLTLTGVAAIGAPIDAATVEALDAEGNTIELTDSTTGNDGRYTVDLPADVNFPVLLRVSTPDGGVLSSIINPANTVVGQTITAHINPITDAVTAELLGGVVADDPAALASSLSQVTADEPEATGNRVTRSLLGESVSFDSFSNDPEFRARTADEAGSMADTVLDVLGMRAAAEGRDIPTLLSDLRSQPDPAHLLHEPSFQVDLLVERIRSGTEESEALGEELRAFGALREDSGDGSDDVLKALVESVPRLVSQIREQSAGQTLDDSSADAAITVASRILGRTLQSKRDVFASDPAALAALAGRTSLTDGIVGIVSESVMPLLRDLGQREVSERVRVTAVALMARIADETASALGAMDLDRPESEILQVAKRFVSNALDGIDVDTVVAIAEGEATLDERLPATPSFREVQARLRAIVMADPTLGDARIVALAPGRWNDDRWGDFVWN